MSILKAILSFLFEVVFDYIKDHPVQTLLVLLAILRLFGTTVQSGWKGLLFVLGRARRELDPGFHWLLPVVYHVRKTPIRAITIHLPPQRMTTADGLVYNVQANLVYRIADVTKALIEIDDLHKGCAALLPLLVQQILSRQTRASLANRTALDEELVALAEGKLQRWGVTVLQAGFVSIAPTKKTLQLTQLNLLAAERQRVLEHYLAEGLTPKLALALLGTDRTIVSRSAMRYHRRRRRKAVPARLQLQPDELQETLKALV